MSVALRIEAIIAAVDRVTRPLSRMQQSVGRFTRSARRSMERVDRVTSRVAKTIGKGLAIAFGAATVAAVGLFSKVSNLADKMDHFAKSARRMDFPIEDLQKWRFIAGQSGVELTKFDKGIQNFTRALGRAKMGTGLLNAGLKKNRPELLKQLIATDNVSDAFDKYLGVIRDSTRAVDKAALADLAFAGAGATMLNITHNSAEAIASMRKEMEENGIVTMQQAQFAEMYNDALDSLTRNMTGFLQSVLIPLMPIMTVVMRRLREWVVANREIIATRIKEWAVGLVTNFQEIVKWVKKVAIGVGIFFALAGAIKAVIAVLTLVSAIAAANPMTLIVLGVIAAIAAITALVYWAEELVAWFESIPGPIRTIVMVLNPFIALLYGFVKVIAYIKENWRSMWNDMLDVAETAVNYLLQNGPISWMIAAGFTMIDLWPAVKKSAISSWSSIVGFFQKTWDSVRKSFNKAINFFSKFVGRTKKEFSPITTFFNDLWDGIVKTFEKAAGKLMKLISPITDLFKKLSGAKDKLIADKIGRVDFGSLKVNTTADAVEKEAKKTNSLLDDIMKESEQLRNSTVESTNHQTSALQKTMNANAARTARVVNQRFIDVSAPFRHFLRGDDEAAAASGGGGFTPMTTSPQTTTQRFLEERSTMSQAEVTLRAASGTSAEVTGGHLGPGIKLMDTGTF